jgi:mannonate dehydratase
MNRRDFVRLTAGGLTAGSVAESLVSAQVARSGGQTGVRPGSDPGLTPKPKPARMKAGTQHGDSDAILRVLAGFGVNHICSRLPSATLDEAWSTEALMRLRDRVESFGITLDMVPLPLSSYEISRSENPAILLGRDPDRDRQIDAICQMIRNASRAGIPSLKYNLTIIGIPRTPPTVGRGGARYSTFVYAQGKQDPPLTIAGRVDADTYWERITYFLERVVPVAEEHKVRLACHPQDPGMPPGKGWRGVETVLGSVAGLERFVRIAESPYHGLNFCQGTVSEMLERPGEQIFDVIRSFGTRGKIFNVHFRNIAGGFLDFRETFIDDGDVDMLRAMRVYKEVGYDGMMMPDHVPTVEGDTDRLQGFAFAFGYIKALIAAVAAEA